MDNNNRNLQVINPYAPRWLLMVTGICFLVLGFLFFFNTIYALVSIAYFIGFFLIFKGITCLCSYFTVKNTENKNGWLIAQGIIDLIIGVLFISNIFALSLSFSIFIAFWALFTGIIEIINSVSFRSYNKHWWVTTIIGILSIILALVIFFNPFASDVILIYLISIFMVIYGVTLIVLFFIRKPKTKETLNNTNSQN